ncbi:MAG TPA: preQ(1) synthase [Anaerolineae bacterium]|nr:preQ(1) synthase [Anaerolineae bacterium]HOG47345.1 preQ(1) synthase [Anaerolineae bacterium]HOQ99006.1 preQ(1) synthase [Anaerolineae bacterium]HPL30618.1 preQ(1) synthase [Anaerolineae bacterium]
MVRDYGLTKLGHQAAPDRKLETFPSRSRPGSLTVQLHCTEFTCRCPVTGQPDWAQIDIEYVPDQSVVESKSLKLYLETYRDEGIFHEHLAQVVLDDFVAAARPLSCTVTVCFNVRGGIAITAVVSYRREA